MSKKKTKKKQSSNNIRVVCRCRPLLDFERARGKVTSIVKSVDETIIQIDHVAGKRYFELDAGMCGAEWSHEDIYRTSGAQNAVTEDIFKGFNCTILAYGQTGSGKTFTMGTASTGDGVIPRACHDLFDNIKSKCDGNAEVKISYMEIYNEEIRDLIAEKPKKLVIRENLNHEIYVSGLESRVVKDPNDIEKYMEEAGGRRAVAFTKMNATSSRSHAIAVLSFKGVLEDGTEVESKLTFVDLAGSEKIAKTGAEGKRRAEGININQGLFVLGQVVSALSETRSKHKRKPPYRDSKLTRLLQDSLGGNSHTIMIACVSPASDNAEETLNTLRYATAARNIKNTATQNVVKSISPEEAAKLERENQMLKNQLKELQENMEAMVMEAMDMSVAGSDTGESFAVSDTSFAIANIAIGGSEREEATDKDKKIEELEKTIKSMEKKLTRAKFNHRKSAIGSAIEMPALKARVEAMEEELKEMEEVKEENEKLYQEVTALKAEASTALVAANRMSVMIESGASSMGSPSSMRPKPLVQLHDFVLSEDDEELDDDDNDVVDELASKDTISTLNHLTAQEEKEELQHALKASHAEAKNLRDSIKSLKAELVQSREATTDASNAVDELRHELSEAQAEVDGLKETIQTLETALSESKELISSMNERAGERGQAVIDLQAESNNLKAKIESLEADLNQSQKARTDTSNQFDEIRQLLSESQAEVYRIRETSQQLESSLTQTQNDAAKSDQAAKQLEKELSVSQEKVKSLTSNVERLKADLETSGQTIVNLQNDLLQHLKRALDDASSKGNSDEPQKEARNLKTIVEGHHEETKEGYSSSDDVELDHVPEQISVQRMSEVSAINMRMSEISEINTAQLIEENKLEIEGLAEIKEEADDENGTVVSSVSRLTGMSLGAAASSILPAPATAGNKTRYVLAFGLQLGSKMLGASRG